MGEISICDEVKILLDDLETVVGALFSIESENVADMIKESVEEIKLSIVNKLTNERG